MSESDNVVKTEAHYTMKAYVSKGQHVYLELNVTYLSTNCDDFLNYSSHCNTPKVFHRRVKWKRSR